MKQINRRNLLSIGGAGLAASFLTPFAKANNNLLKACTSIIPSETAGPYPAHSDDRGVNFLTQPGALRKKIISSVGTNDYPGVATAKGIPLNVKLQIVDGTNGCAPLEGYVVYIWHCDETGLYSMYNTEVIEETYLRGVQLTDNNGYVEFETVYPGCYDGRMVHMHFDVFKSIDLAVNNKTITKTSQLTFPVEVSKAVYDKNSHIYTNGAENLARISFETDNVFNDGYASQLASIDSGNAISGFTSSLQVVIDPTNIEQIGGGPGGPGGPNGPGGKPPGPPPQNKKNKKLS